MDFDLLQCQPSVLVHAEVVQNFGRRFSVRIFHLAGAKERGGASDDQVEMHVVEIHLLWQSGWERGRERTRGGGGGGGGGVEAAVMSTDGGWGLRSVARRAPSPVFPPWRIKKKKTSGSAVRTLLRLCWSTAAVTSSPSEGVLRVCRAGPPLRRRATPLLRSHWLRAPERRVQPPQAPSPSKAGRARPPPPRVSPCLCVALQVVNSQPGYG